MATNFAQVTTSFKPRRGRKATAISSLSMSSASRGYYQRDVTNGLLPELEDCQQAAEALWDLQQVYEPQQGSGLVVDNNENGEDF